MMATSASFSQHNWLNGSHIFKPSSLLATAKRITQNSDSRRVATRSASHHSLPLVHGADVEARAAADAVQHLLILGAEKFRAAIVHDDEVKGQFSARLITRCHRLASRFNTQYKFGTIPSTSHHSLPQTPRSGPIAPSLYSRARRMIAPARVQRSQVQLNNGEIELSHPEPKSCAFAQWGSALKLFSAAWQEQVPLRVFAEP